MTEAGGSISWLQQWGEEGGGRGKEGRGERWRDGECVCTLPAVFRSNIVIVIRVSHDGEAAALRGERRGEERGAVVSFVSSFRGLRGETRVSSIELKVAGILLQGRLEGGGRYGAE